MRQKWQHIKEVNAIDWKRLNKFRKRYTDKFQIKWIKFKILYTTENTVVPIFWMSANSLLIFTKSRGNLHNETAKLSILCNKLPKLNWKLVETKHADQIKQWHQRDMLLVHPAYQETFKQDCGLCASEKSLRAV